MSAVGSSSIYVQVPAYRDPLLASTLDDLFAQAAHPECLRVRVCWQRARSDSLPSRHRRSGRIELDEVDFRDSRGANWARRRAQAGWAGEPYSFIIDSHLRFARHWDRKCVALLEGMKSDGVKRPILTCYPPNFDPATYPARRPRTPLKNYKETYIDGLLVHFAGFRIPLWQWLRKPIPAQFLALGFLFSEGRFNEDIRLDPEIYFFGDEITTGVRAYCHGYDFFHPHRVLAWHAYDRATRRCHWEDHRNWRERDRASLDRVRSVLRGRSYPGHPIGTRRTIRQYERFIGMPLVLP